ncbi:hypothetical protein DDU33_07765 [Actinobacillus porcitonsillarum]|uniref:Uncharacterized protein n=1 Tax=Actinobacillus porcitonsillarum TaxID=189834 RepID=A0A2U8FKF9_9PAST|nr:hypothetical protein [Actinobacillus porcitonsillarum]AWI51387.1 hypothetical protein DDU33_07765 [Actinobacillus porcitonsillarum]
MKKNLLIGFLITCIIQEIFQFNDTTIVISWIIITFLCCRFNIIELKNKLVPEKHNIFDDSSKKTEKPIKDFYTLWKGKPFTISCRLDSEPRSKEHSCYQYGLNSKGYEKLVCRNIKGEEYLLDLASINTALLYKSKRYYDIDELLINILGKDTFFSTIEKKRTLIYEEIQEHNEKVRQSELLAYHLRNESRTVIFPFSEREISFSIFGDYFDKSLPSNNMKYTLICSGLYGYPDTKEVTALFGKDLKQKDVIIRINAIRTKITLDKKKYSVPEFIELAKTF